MCFHLPERGHQRIFFDKHGQQVVHYKFDRLEPGEYIDLGYVVGITLRNIHWNASGQARPEKTPTLTAEERKRYLTPETNYSMDSEVMKSAAAELVDGAATDYEKLSRIHDYVVNYLAKGSASL